MTKPALISFLVSSSLIAACGGGTPPPPAEQSAPAPAAAPAVTTPDKPAEPAPAPPAPSAPEPAVPPPAQSAPPAQTAPPAAVAKPVAPAKPIYTRTDLQAGTGREAVKGKGLSVNYTGWLYDPSQPAMKGRMFDSSQGRGPFNFVLGTGQVIPGWDQGFDGMKIGGRRRLIIPPDLAYGVDGAGGGIIPPNATLIFEMELLDVQQ